MKKLLSIIVVMMALCLCLALAACGEKNAVDNTKQYALNFNSVYALAEEAGYTGSLDDLVELFKGQNAYQLAVAYGYTGTPQQWLDSLVGAAGKDGATPTIGVNKHWFVEGVDTGIVAEGKDGQDGNGIDRIEKTATEGNVDTYTIYYTNGTTAQFEIRNGRDGYSIVEIDQDGRIVINGVVTDLYADQCDHTYGEWVALKDSTCTVAGLRVKVCASCGNGYHDVIPALGHDLVHHDGKAATCTEAGWEAYDACTRCGYSTYSSRLEALGHDYTDGICARCGEGTQGLRYALLNDGTYAVTGYGGSASEVVIHLYQGKAVTSIGEDAFRGLGLTGITIPESVTSIGDGAFRYCYRLVEVYNKSSLNITAGSSAYGYVGYYAKNVYTTEGGSKLTLGTDGYLRYADADTVSLIAYYGNETQLTIPEDITKIYQYAFYGCSGLSGITIPDSVTSIGGSAFSGCSGLTSVTIGSGVTSIGTSAFYNCSGLTSVTIPKGVTSIGDYAFYGCSGLTCITIPAGVTSIGNSAFSGCSSLESITIPFVGAVAGKTANDTYQYPFGYIFGTSSYTGGTATKQSYYGSSTSSTTTATYYIPSSLRSVTVTGGNILCGAFDGCSGLTSITIPEGVTSIGVWAFYNCSGLTGITIPDSVTSIGEIAFNNCTGLTTITVAEGNTVYHSAGNCIIHTADKALVVGCKTSVIPTDGSVTSIGKGAFGGCGLTSITIPNCVTSIGEGAFQVCSGLTSISIPNSVTSIGERAFFCSGLASIRFQGTKAQWNAISKYSSWNDGTGNCIIHCTDGNISK